MEQIIGIVTTDSVSSWLWTSKCRLGFNYNKCHYTKNEVFHFFSKCDQILNGKLISLCSVYLKLTSWRPLHKKRKFSTKDFFSKCDQITVSCTFGHLYQRNPWWKTSFCFCAVAVHVPLLLTLNILSTIFRIFPVDIYLLKVNNRHIKPRCEISSKLIIKIPERPLASLWCLYC